MKIRMVKAKEEIWILVLHCSEVGTWNLDFLDLKNKINVK
jgi:hypothetical protein